MHPAPVHGIHGYCGHDSPGNHLYHAAGCPHQGLHHRQIKTGHPDILLVNEKETYLVVDGVEVSAPVSALKVKDIVAVHTGERIPADGVIVSGQAVIYDSHITGRSVPEYRSKGDKTFAGTVVHDGATHIRVEKTGNETYLARGLDMVEKSLASRAPVMDNVIRNFF